MVDTQTGATTSLTAGECRAVPCRAVLGLGLVLPAALSLPSSPGAPQGSWSVLTIDRDLLVAKFSTPSCPPTLVRCRPRPHSDPQPPGRWH